jgi:tetratricopeptide (TPR) repeat protein
MGKQKESLLSYKMVVQLDPNNAEAWFDYGDTLLELGHLEDALSALDRSIELNPKFAEPYYSKAKLFFITRKITDAIEALKTAFGLDSSLRERFDDDFSRVRSIKEFVGSLLRS